MSLNIIRKSIGVNLYAYTVYEYSNVAMMITLHDYITFSWAEITWRLRLKTWTHLYTFIF